MMAHVDLCSGIGGFALGFEWAGLSKPVMFCDIEPWSRKVLAKHWPDVPIAHDVKELASDPTRLVPNCDILTAGYPCQPFSVAGKQRGEEDDRHIWPEIFAIVQEKRPSWCVFENVSGHISLGLDQVLSDLEDKAGYAVQTFCIGAVSVNAPHRRQRIWIIAHINSQGEPDGTINEQRMVGNTSNDGWHRGATQAGREGQTHQSDQPELGIRGEFSRPSEDVADTDSKPSKVRGQHQTDATESLRRGSDARGSRGNDRWEFGASPNDEDVADPNRERLQGQWPQSSGVGAEQRDPCDPRRWNTESRICDLADGLPKGLDRFDGWEREPEDIPRVATGVKDRVSRLRGLGNAIVPQIAMQIGLTIKAVRDE